MGVESLSYFVKDLEQFMLYDFTARACNLEDRYIDKHNKVVSLLCIPGHALGPLIASRCPKRRINCVNDEGCANLHEFITIKRIPKRLG